MSGIKMLMSCATVFHVGIYAPHRLVEVRPETFECIIYDKNAHITLTMFVSTLEMAKHVGRRFHMDHVYAVLQHRLLY